jgi:hypothetical protein
VTRLMMLERYRFRPPIICALHPLDVVSKGPFPDRPQACDTRQVTKATRRRPVGVLAVMAALSCLVSACGRGPAQSGVARLGTAKTTTTQSAAPVG